ncbi:hypothetical protein M2157_000458 [Streptomyces sp. SAI-127]|nr:hypothetical protein [Streptomyces sp. SAI-127]
MAARARTWRLKFLRAVIAAFHALSDGSPATSHEAIGLQQRPETLVPLPPTGDRAGDGRGRFGVGHAVGHHAVTRRLRQHPSTRPGHLERPTRNTSVQHSVCGPHAGELVRSLGAVDIIDRPVRYDFIPDAAGNRPRNRPLTRLDRSFAPPGTVAFVGGKNGGRVVAPGPSPSVSRSWRSHLPPVSTWRERGRPPRALPVASPTRPRSPIVLGPRHRQGALGAHLLESPLAVVVVAGKEMSVTAGSG